VVLGSLRNLLAVGLLGGPRHGGNALGKKKGGDNGELHVKELNGSVLGCCINVKLMRML
jgi:hypothetical protein